MLSIKHVTRKRSLLFPILAVNHTLAGSGTSQSAAVEPSATSLNFLKHARRGLDAVITREAASSLKEWLRRANSLHLNSLPAKICKILSADGGNDRESADHALAQLNLQLSEPFVLEVLQYGKREENGVLLCLKFFDWAGRQPLFSHTRATFLAIFKILEIANRSSSVIDLMEDFTKKRYSVKVKFYDILVMGYAVAGKPEIALQLFGRMRFQGLDLDVFAYNVLLNALVEMSYFETVQVIEKQIWSRGFCNAVTHSIMLKSLCKQNHLERAQDYLYGLVREGKGLNPHLVGGFVDALCNSRRFKEAGSVVEEFRELGLVPMDYVYGVWLRDLVQAGHLDKALEFLQTKKCLEGYIPHTFQYNTLIIRLLKENWLEDVRDLLLEMKDNQVSPHNWTVNVALCLFCKAGMVEDALELYHSRADFGLSPTGMAYNCLINMLCRYGKTDEAYCILKNSIEHNYFPCKSTVDMLADALCSEAKLDKMKELVTAAINRNFLLRPSTYDKFISALCKEERIKDGYSLLEELNKAHIAIRRESYLHLIHGLNRYKRWDMAAKLLIEMQEKGHKVYRPLYRAIICSLCEMEDSRERLFRLLDIQLRCLEPSCQVYNFFIDGAGHAGKPEIAREIYEMMSKNGIVPNTVSNILMLQSYLKSRKISDALLFFNDLRRGGQINKKLYHTMVTGLCKVDRVNIALEYMNEMREQGMVPSSECYEVLVQMLCVNKKYDSAIDIVKKLEKAGRHVTSFMANVLLFHSLKTEEIYEAWLQIREEHDETSASSILGKLIGVFCGRIKLVDDSVQFLEEAIKQCFVPDIYTYNVVLAKLSISDVDRALQYFDCMCKRGDEPNRWTYMTLARGLFRSGRADEASLWLNEVVEKGL